MKIGEIIDLSTKYTPERSCMVFLTMGCNLNCKFCNKSHLLHKDGGKNYDVDNLLGIVKTNYLIKCIYLLGGEPILQDDIIVFCQRLSQINRYIILQTNGLFPNKIKKILPYLNRIILNLKGPLNGERYSKITNKNINIDNLIESFSLLNTQKKIPFDIKVTYVKGAQNPEDIHSILKFLTKKKFTGKFILKQYEYLPNVKKEFKQKFKEPEHIDLIEILEPYVDKNLPYKIFLEDNVYEHAEIHKVFQKIIKEGNNNE